MQNIKPSTRPLIQFVSPNSSFLGRIVRVTNTQITRLVAETNRLQDLEDSEVSGFVIADPFVREISSNTINDLKGILSCPLILQHNLESETDLYRIRKIRGDAALTKISQFSKYTLQSLFNKAQAMNLLLICEVQSLEDWQKIESLSPRFIFVEKSFEFLQTVPSTTWWIGSIDFDEPTKLKCQMEGML